MEPEYIIVTKYQGRYMAEKLTKSEAEKTYNKVSKENQVLCMERYKLIQATRAFLKHIL
jgi:hypothetical protein